MATPRHQLVDGNLPLCYHLVSRCVRRSWLCGFDKDSRRNFSHRRDWLLARLRQLAGAFAVDVYAYAIMSNHFHLVVYYDPNAASQWTDCEVADRWLRACPPKRADGTVDQNLKRLRRTCLLEDPVRLKNARRTLGSLSFFMKFLKQPIARRANLEDGLSGHFFEQRFYSGALLSKEAVLAAMAYVDLNPVRARIAKSITEADYTSIHERIVSSKEALDEYLRPVIPGLGVANVVSINLRDYINHLEVLLPTNLQTWPRSKLKRWREAVAMLRRRQRAFGPPGALSRWLTVRGWRQRELPLWG